ncbi:MAG: DUF3667 domain-containing protein [Saprospiraceae bacterium]|nr:DUF3667 domain-containing protein [Saprospiraceae bacterium]
MNHKKRRTEKHCLNCSHEVEERFCTQCGQENLELNDSTLHLIIHYIQDLFHYDGKLWHTMKSLVTRPGLVAKEYLEGKRQRHLEPIRFYVFASSVFFLTFFIFIGDETYTSSVTPETNYSKRLYNLEQEKSFLQGTADTVYANTLIHSIQRLQIDVASIADDSSASEVEIELFDVQADTAAQVGWLEYILDEGMLKRAEELEKEHEGDEVKATTALVNEVVHTLPQLFFLSLPFFALFLKLLYWRSQRKTFVEHFIFSIYHYAFLFIIMLLFILVVATLRLLGSEWEEEVESWLALIVIVYPVVYLFLSMRLFYKDQWIKLTLKYIALSALLITTIIVLFVMLAVITFFF